MARTINEIQQTSLDAIASAPELSALEVLTTQEQQSLQPTSASKVAKWRLWVWVFSMAVWHLERLWDVFRDETEARVAATRPHTKEWYREKGLNYLHGIELVPETDYYDTSALTDEQITQAKIIANAACIKEILYGAGRLRIKVVKLVNGQYVQLTNEELTGFTAYMNQVSDAGTLVVCTSGPADMLRIDLDVYYDPTILNPFGQRLDGTDPQPVQNAIKNYLKSLRFNGSFIKTKLVNELEAVQGVFYPEIKNAWSKYGAYEYDTEGISNVGLINVIRIADAGHMKLDEAELNINWIAYTE